MRPPVTVRENDALPHHIQKDRIRKVRTGAGARGEMEVAAHRNHWRNRGERIERARLVHIARMENSGDVGRCEDFRYLRWERGEPVRDMRVRENAKSNGMHGTSLSTPRGGMCPANDGECTPEHEKVPGCRKGARPAIHYTAQSNILLARILVTKWNRMMGWERAVIRACFSCVEHDVTTRVCSTQSGCRMKRSVSWLLPMHRISRTTSRS